MSCHSYLQLVITRDGWARFIKKGKVKLCIDVPISETSKRLGNVCPSTSPGPFLTHSYISSFSSHNWLAALQRRSGLTAQPLVSHGVSSARGPVYKRRPSKPFRRVVPRPKTPQGAWYCTAKLTEEVPTAAQ
jgi:hypothetical protein